MTPTKDQQAQEYAEKVNYPCPDYGWYESDDKQMKECLKRVWLDGYAACEQSMWRSVEEELPEPDTMCLVFGYQDLDFDGRLTQYTMMAWYDGEDFMDAYNDRKYHPVKWMAIPPIPPIHDTNTEKH